MNEDLYTFLTKFVTEQKVALFDRILENRTRYITVILEDIYQSQNASAVLRSCDTFGIQDVHIIENNHKYNVNKDIALGSAQWLELKKYNKTENNTLECINNLKSKGYKIIATSPHKNDFSLPSYPLTDKTALIFGSELPGLSKIAMENADGYLKYQCLDLQKV